MMDEAVVIPSRFNGPPQSANGGYACACVARFVEGTAEVSLREPPPLERELEPRRGADGRVALFDGESLVAEGAPAELELELPAPVSVQEAGSASEGFPYFESHPFPTCFVCGPRRAAGDGLRIFAGPVEGSDVFAAAWTPERSLAGEDGVVRDEFIWAALDCPTSTAVVGPSEATPFVLARLAVRRFGSAQGGQPHVIVSWALGRDGRKREAAAALFSAEGELRAGSRALWIGLSDD